MSQENSILRIVIPLVHLRIRDHRGLVLKLHLRLLDYIQFFLVKTENRDFHFRFLFGIMEGDRSVSGGKNRCRLGITCKKVDRIIPFILKKIEINYMIKKHLERKNVIDYTFGLIPILHNFHKIQKNIFKYYPKRRKIFIKRLFKLASIQYLLRERETLSNFALTPLKKNNLLNDEKLIIGLKELKRELVS